MAVPFKVGDRVVGNKLASHHYGITREGWIGTVESICLPETIEVRGYGGVFNVMSYAFDLYKEKELYSTPLSTKPLEYFREECDKCEQKESSFINRIERDLGR